MGVFELSNGSSERVVYDQRTEGDYLYMVDEYHVM